MSEQPYSFNPDALPSADYHPPVDEGSPEFLAMVEKKRIELQAEHEENHKGKWFGKMPVISEPELRQAAVNEFITEGLKKDRERTLRENKEKDKLRNQA